MNIPANLFALVAGHFVCDYPLQNSVMAHEKSRLSTSELQKHVPWYHWLTAHAFVHGFMVFLILWQWQLGLAEVVVHWVTDYLKSTRLIGMKTDQAIHLTAKVVWLAMICYLW